MYRYMLGIIASVSIMGAMAPGAQAKKGCNTKSCVQRVAIKHKKEFVKPYTGWLYRLRQCESGSHGLYLANTGNGFFGAYQFTPQTWRNAGGWGLPHQNPPYEQDYRAVKWRLRIGNPHSTMGWPVCG